MTPTNPNPIDPDSAIWSKDLAELRRALDAGWDLPPARVKDGGTVPDLGPVIRIISTRWTEGWLLLSAHMSWLHSNAILRSLAVRRAVPGIVEDFLAHGMTPNDVVDDTAYSSLRFLHLLAETMGPQPGEPVPEEDIIQTGQLLLNAGAAPLDPYPGQFEVRGASPSGHTLWSRAVSFRAWAVASAFLPESFDDVLGQPRGLEAAYEIRSCAEDDSAILAQAAWAQWLDRFLEPWMQATEQKLDAPADWRVLPRLSAERRAVVWDAWARPDENGWTVLHELALQGATPLAQDTLRLVINDGASCLASWGLADPDGTRPYDLWALANKKEVDPNSAPELPDL